MPGELCQTTTLQLSLAVRFWAAFHAAHAAQQSSPRLRLATTETFSSLKSIFVRGDRRHCGAGGAVLDEAAAIADSVKSISSWKIVRISTHCGCGDT